MATGGLASTGRRDADQSTPMACRPAYQPQFPQTRCGRLVALQRGQAPLRARTDARAIHGDLTQPEREKNLDAFRSGRAMRRRIRVCSTMCARKWR